MEPGPSLLHTNHALVVFDAKRWEPAALRSQMETSPIQPFPQRTCSSTTFGEQQVLWEGLQSLRCISLQHAYQQSIAVIAATQGPGHHQHTKPQVLQAFHNIGLQADTQSLALVHCCGTWLHTAAANTRVHPAWPRCRQQQGRKAAW